MNLENFKLKLEDTNTVEESNLDQVNGGLIWPFLLAKGEAFARGFVYGYNLGNEE